VSIETSLAEKRSHRQRPEELSAVVGGRGCHQRWLGKWAAGRTSSCSGGKGDGALGRLRGTRGQRQGAHGGGSVALGEDGRAHGEKGRGTCG
jgi:hypothetical protein